jgi:putative tributyrin esterase
MAVITLHFYPPKLAIATTVRILIPVQRGPEAEALLDGIADPSAEAFKAYFTQLGKLPVLWLLHGGSDNYADWHHYTILQQLSDQYGYAVVMPDAQNSSYSNMAHGPAWFDYFTEELPEYIYSRFPFSRKREDNFIAGMSMGGQGTLKIALHQPERFSVAVPIASGVDVVNQYAALKPGEKGRYSMFAITYGCEDDPSKALGGPEDNFAALRRAVEAGKTLPHMMQAQGTEDFTYDGNRRFNDYAKSIGVDIQWIEAPGKHDWYSWNLYIPKVFEFIAQCREKAQ